MNLKHVDSISWRSLQAEALLLLVREHRESCNGKCNISLTPLRELYKRLVGRELMPEEEVFY